MVVVWLRLMVGLLQFVYVLQNGMDQLGNNKTRYTIHLTSW